VSTNPRALLTDPDPVGFADDQMIVTACTGRDDRTVVVAWGANGGHPRLRPRVLQVLDLLDGNQVPCWVLGITADDHPAHPLGLPRDAPLRPKPLPRPHPRVQASQAAVTGRTSLIICPALLCAAGLRWR